VPASRRRPFLLFSPCSGPELIATGTARAETGLIASTRSSITNSLPTCLSNTMMVVRDLKG